VRRPVFVLCAVALLACGRPSRPKPPPAADAGADAGSEERGPTDGGSAGSDGGADAPPESPAPSPEAGADATADASSATDAGDGPGPALVPFRALGVALGDTFACALRDDHSVFCWGTNAPKVEAVPGHTVSKLAADTRRACAILDDGSVTCWSFSSDTLLTTASALDLPAGRRASQIAMSAYTTYVVLDDETVFYATSMRTGIIQRPPGAAFIRQIASGYGAQLGAVYEDGTYAPEIPYALARPYLLGSEQAHVLTMTTSRRSDFWAWVKVGGGTVCEGVPYDVHPDPTMPLVEIVAGTSFLCGRRPDGGVRCWGTFPGCREGAPSLSYWCDGQVTTDRAHDVLLGLPAVSLAASSDYTRLACAVLVDGSIKCWGGAVDLECATGDVASCQAPATLDPVVGASVEIAGAAGGRTYGAWRAVDLGSHP
jgi:hypothetical protein